MDNNLLGITTLAQQTSKTPLITGDKKQQLMSDIQAQNMNSDQQLANNMSQTRLEKMSTMDYNNTRRSPFKSTNKNGYDESNDNISSSNYDQTTLFGSPGLNKSYDKTAKGKLMPIASQNNQQQPNIAQRQNSNLSYQSPDKARRGSNAKSGRSNSSRGESSDRGHQHRHGSAARNRNSVSRGRSYSGTDQDSQERSFTYPCQAFKQFLLAVREGKIDMKDLNNSPFLIDYLTMQAQIGGQGSNGGTGGGGDRAFANSLRSSTASNRSGSKNRDNSRSNKKPRQGNYGESLKAPRDSIIEEEEDDNGQTGTHAKSHNFKPTSAVQKKPTTQGITNQQKNQSPLKQPRVSQVQNQPNLTKHNFKEDSKNPRVQNTQSPMKQSHQQQNPHGQTSESKKPRRSRNDRSTSGDERAGGAAGRDKGDSSDGGVIDLRFDDKGRPIKNTNVKPKHQFNTNQNVGNKPGAVNAGSDDDQLTNDYNTNHHDGKDDGKKRRRRGDRDSSIGGSNSDGGNNQLNNNNAANKGNKRNNSQNSKSNSKSRKDNNNNNITLSPNEPRSISKLPKPTERDDKPQQVRQSQNNLNQSNVMLPPISERVNANGDGGEDESLREYGDSNMSQSHRTGNADSSRLPIFDKNTDFKTEEDYSLNALKDNTTKKYLKSNKSPLKKQQFREDEDDATNNNNVINLNDDDYDNDKIQTFNDNSSINDRQSETKKHEEEEQESQQQNSDRYYQKYQEPPSIAVYQRKTPLRENRKVNSSNGIVNSSSKNQPFAGGATLQDQLGNSIGGDDLQRQDIDSVKFQEQMESLNQGSPLKGMGDRSRSNFSNNNMQNSQGSMLQNLNDYQNQQYNSVNNNRSPTDKPMTRDDLEGSGNELNNNYQSGTDNQKSANKKKRRDRASRVGNQSSDVSMERQPFEARQFNSNSQTQQLGNSQSMNQSPSKSNRNGGDDGHQLTIEEHLDTYRSKTSSQVNLTMRSGRSQYKQDDDYDNLGDLNNDNYAKSGRASNYNNQTQQSPMKSVRSKRSNNAQQQNSSTNKHKGNNTGRYVNNDGDDDYEDFDNNNNRNDIDDNDDNDVNDADEFTDRVQYNDQDKSNRNSNYQYNNADVVAGGNTNKSSPTKRRYQEHSNRSNKNNMNDINNNDGDQDQDVYDQDRSQNSGRQDSSRYHDDYNNQMSSSRKDNNPSERKRQNRRSNVNNSSNHNIKFDNVSGGTSSRNNLHDNMNQSQRSLTNLANTNYDEYNYSSFGQQQQQQPGDRDGGDVNDNQNNTNNNSTSKKPRRKRGSRERSNDSGKDNYNSSGQEDHQRSSQIKQSLVPLRGPRDRQNNQYASQNDQYKTNYSSTGYQNINHNNNNNNQANDDQQKLKKYQSRLKELEDKLKKQVQENPSKPLDYRLIQEINDEAARTIQLQFRLRKMQKKQKEDAGHRHGNLVDRMIQTEPINLYTLGMKYQTGIGKNGQFDMDKFKRFFFAVFYTYMMMNTIMADVFKRQQPMQTNNQWNEQDYKNYMQNRQNNNKK